MSVPLTDLQSICVINVRAFTERLAHVRAQLARFDLTAQVINEWDREALTPQIEAQYFCESPLSQAQKSCAMKHVVALQPIATGTAGYHLVLEDDVVLAEDFMQGLKAALREAPHYPDPHVIFLGCGGNFYTPRSQRRQGQRLYPATRGRFADSYLITPATAQRRLQWIELNRISQPMDNQFESMDRILGIQMLWLEDPVVEQGSKLGLFDTSLEPAHSGWVQWLKFHLEKLRRKYVYQLWR